MLLFLHVHHRVAATLRFYILLFPHSPITPARRREISSDSPVYA